MKVLVLAERAKAIRELCAGARGLGDVELVALTSAQVVTGVADKVFSVSLPEGVMMEDSLDTLLPLIAAEKPDAFFVEPTKRLKLLAGRLAARLGASGVTDILSVADDASVSAMYFGGLARKNVKASGPLAILYIGAGVFSDAIPSGTDTVVPVDFVAGESKVTRRSVAPIVKSGVDLTAAKRVVGIGRGLAAEADLEMINEFASVIDAEVGCTRPITEAEHWLPKETYIGVSGLILTPDVYVAIGISGQTQHTVGIDRSKTIFAINKDKNAPIFAYADYGIVADLYKVVPKLVEGLK